jgi:phosphoribosylanthranilate isomerase
VLGLFGCGGLRREPSAEDKKNILLAFKHIGDPVAVTNVIANAGDYSKQVGFARLIQLKAYDQIVAVMCGHEMTEFIRAEPGKRDISQKDAEKIVSRLPAEQKYYEALALKAKSNNIRAVAVSKVENQKVLSGIVLNGDSEIRALALSRLTDQEELVKVAKNIYDFETFKTALNKIDNIRLLEDFILSESGLYISDKFNYAVANIKDGAFLIELLNKAKDLKARKAIAEAIPQADITVDLYEKEKDKEIRRILKNRASEEVQQELARVRLEKIKKAIVIAERDGKELLDLIATKKNDQIDGKKVAEFFGGRFLIVKDAEMLNNGVVKHINGERREGCVIIAEKPTGDELKRNTSMFMDVIFASRASSVKEKFTIGNNVIAMGVVDGNSHIAFEMFGCVVAKDNGLSDKEILHVFDVFDPDDEALDLTISGADKSPTARYAESVGWEIPEK